MVSLIAKSLSEIVGIDNSDINQNEETTDVADKCVRIREIRGHSYFGCGQRPRWLIDLT
jgi:hypothetical protein